MFKNNSYVYGHYKADTGELFYIGKGTGKRVWSKNDRNDRWRKVVDEHGYFVKILYENLSEEDAFNKEKELIVQVGLENLTNIVEGGKGFSVEQARQLADKRKDDIEYLKKMEAVYSSDNWRNKNKARAQRLKQDNTHQEKMQRVYTDPKWLQTCKEAAQRTAQDPEWRRKNKEILQQRTQDPEWRRKNKERLQKMHQTPEWRRKITEHNQRNAQNPERIRKIKEAAQRRAQDPEWQKKQRETAASRRKKVILVSPTDEIVHVCGISEFAKNNELCASSLQAVVSGKRKHHKGWKLYKPEEHHKILEFVNKI